MRTPSRKIPFQEIARLALSLSHQIASEIAPNGRVQGREYKALNPRRDDKRIGSFSINLTTGAWADFATGERGGDLISLVAWRHGISQCEAARLLANRLGMRAW